MEDEEGAFVAPATDGAQAPSTLREAPSSIAGWTVYAVDSHSLIFQVFHAMQGSELSSPRGEPVGAVYGFTRDMLQLLERRRPTAILCAFDLPGTTFRHELYEAYKGDRGEMPEELVSQIPKIRQVLEALGIPVLDSPGFEADDVLATVARLCDEARASCYVVTGDKDCRQLITPHVSVYNIRKDEVYDAAALEADWGIRPDQVVDFQALVGDKVDNVPGVPLIGPKVAKELLDQYGSLMGVLDHASEVAGAKRRENLLKHRDDAILSRKLVELDRHVPVTPDWGRARAGQIDPGRIAELFREFGFRSLADRALAVAKLYDGPAGGVGSSAASPDLAERTRLFPDSWEANYRVVDTPAGLAELIATLSACERISVDTETTDVNPRFAEIVGYSFAWAPGEACYVPVRGPAGSTTLDPQATAAALRPILENPAIAKIGQNLKYDMVVLKSAGIELRGIAFDTMVASYLLDAGERSHNLDHLALTYLDHETIKIDSLIGKGKSQLRMDEVPASAAGQYAAEDADVPLRLLPILQERLAGEGLAELNDAVETPLIEVLAELEHRGVSVDVERLGELSNVYTDRLTKLSQDIEELAGRPLNIASPKQLAELLFTEFKLPVIKKTKTGPSTDASVLEELAPLHPLPAMIVEHRQYAKLLGTYIDALPKLVHPVTGRVHSSLNQVVAATGRLSSNNPNLQNIPVRTREGKEIRSAFKAGPPGWILLAADYSQIELRVLAHFTRDETLCAAFANDEDIHRLVAAQVNGVAMDEVTPEMRRAAKAVNFGIIYGQSPFGLAKALGISKEEAAAFIEAYFGKYPGVLDFFIETLGGCRSRGCVSTLLGRKRKVDGVRTPPPGLREPSGALRQLNLPERTAVNTVIQGSAADLIKLAMLQVHRRLKAEGTPAAMLLQIHDELLFETPPEEAEALGRLVREEMTTVMELAVPLAIDVKTGPNWAECE
ncbi:MAG: DNA polymerase I [Pirellulales bacterium]|nr:DNA polymerase I [Pirellulales bacterium]